MSTSSSARSALTSIREHVVLAREALRAIVDVLRIYAAMQRAIAAGKNGWDFEINIPANVRIVFGTIQVDTTESGIHLNSGGSYEAARKTFNFANMVSHQQKVAARKRKALAYKFKRHPAHCSCGSCK
jgi:N-glycosylase/DNA lyase